MWWWWLLVWFYQEEDRRKKKLWYQKHILQLIIYFTFRHSVWLWCLENLCLQIFKKLLSMAICFLIFHEVLLFCQMLIYLIPILTNASLIGYYYDSSLVLAAIAVNNKHINSTYWWQTKSNSVLISCHSNPNTIDKFFVSKVTLGVQ